MPSLNKVMLMGNVTRDPEVRYTPKGSAVTDIGLAVNRSYTTNEGERREDTTFVDITFWGRQAEVLGEYIRKGRPLYVEGRLNLDSWEDKQSGQQRSRLKVIGENFQFLGGRDEAGGGQHSSSYETSGPPSGQAPSAAPREDSSPTAPQYGGGGNPIDEEEDDIPF